MLGHAECTVTVVSISYGDSALNSRRPSNSADSAPDRPRRIKCTVTVISTSYGDSALNSPATPRSQPRQSSTVHLTAPGRYAASRARPRSRRIECTVTVVGISYGDSALNCPPRFAVGRLRGEHGLDSPAPVTAPAAAPSPGMRAHLARGSHGRGHADRELGHDGEAPLRGRSGRMVCPHTLLADRRAAFHPGDGLKVVQAPDDRHKQGATAVAGLAKLRRARPPLLPELLGESPLPLGEGSEVIRTRQRRIGHRRRAAQGEGEQGEGDPRSGCSTGWCGTRFPAPLCRAGSSGADPTYMSPGRTFRR